jgi:hypothetical protein
MSLGSAGPGSAATTGWSTFARRLAGALRLNGVTYREVARDPSGLSQAIAVILLSSLASAIVFLINGDSPGLSVDVDWGSYPITRESNAAAALAGGILDGSWGLIVWALQAAVIWFLWNQFSGRQRSWSSIAAPLGFANAALIIFAFLELVPAVGGALGVVGLFWTLVASVVALRESLDIGWSRAILLLVVSVVVLLPLSVALSIVT